MGPLFVALGWLILAGIVTVYVSAAAIGGGLIATYLPGKASKYPPWRRYQAPDEC